MILLLGGTTESLEIADLLTQLKLDFVTTVISEYGRNLAQAHANHVEQIVFDEQSFAQFCERWQIELVIDATHPFARVISQLAMTQAATLSIQYFRFERQSLIREADGIVSVESFDEAVDYLAQIDGQIYLSTGSKTAPDYAHQLGVERLHVRVLPTARVLQNLADAGYQASQVDAIQGPFSVELNQELFRKADAQVVVTKESGRQGGVQEKMAACQELKIPCVIIRRPRLDYPIEIHDLAELRQKLEAK